SEEINLKEIFTEGKYSDKISIEDDVKYTLDNNLNIKILKASTSLQEDSEVIKRAALLPTVAFQFDYGVSSKIGFNEAFKSENQSWNATIAVNYDIFSWGENLNKLQRAKNETAKAKESEKNSITNIEIAVRNSYLNLLKYDKMIDSKNKSYLSAKENYEIYKEKLDVGIISTTDFLTAESNLRKA
ncbi:MAG: TolC family protein, partial [Patescibacteria group bacterium]